jgi:hypothetical protein
MPAQRRTQEVSKHHGEEDPSQAIRGESMIFGSNRGSNADDHTRTGTDACEYPRTTLSTTEYDPSES